MKNNIKNFMLFMLFYASAFAQGEPLQEVRDLEEKFQKIKGVYCAQFPDEIEAQSHFSCFGRGNVYEWNKQLKSTLKEIFGISASEESYFDAMYERVIESYEKKNIAHGQGRRGLYGFDMEDFKEKICQSLSAQIVNSPPTSPMECFVHFLQFKMKSEPMILDSHFFPE